jgi:MoxR-like ATPase
MLPADIVGGSIYQKDEMTQQGAFVFHPGPVFSQVVLADEINRATPKTQSALLEAMEERQVSIDGKTHALPQPFFVIATQNPVSQSGTFTLPESQLDRFLMRIELGYPNAKAERALLEGKSTKAMSLPVLMDEAQLTAYQQKVAGITASASLLDYIQKLVAKTREHPQLRYGLSPRATLALLNTAKSWALLHGRDHVLPDDVQDVFRFVAQHRLEDALVDSKMDICADIIQNVSVL